MPSDTEKKQTTSCLLMTLGMGSACLTDTPRSGAYDGAWPPLQADRQRCLPIIFSASAAATYFSPIAGCVCMGAACLCGRTCAGISHYDRPPANVTEATMGFQSRRGKINTALCLLCLVSSCTCPSASCYNGLLTAANFSWFVENERVENHPRNEAVREPSTRSM